MADKIIQLTDLNTGADFYLTADRIIDVFDFNDEPNARINYINNFTEESSVDVEEEASAISTAAGNLVEVTSAETGETSYVNYANVVMISEATGTYSTVTMQRAGSNQKEIVVTESPSSLESEINGL